MTAGRIRRAFVNIGTMPGAIASPVWAEMRRISDVKISRGRSTSDRMFRGAKNKKKVTGYMENGVTFKYNPARAGSQQAAGDAVITKLEASLYDDLILDVCFMDHRGVGSGAKGKRGPMLVSKMDEDEADESAISYDIELVEAEDEDGAGNLREFGNYTIT